MIIFFKKYLTQVSYIDLLQSLVLIIFFIIFCLTVFLVYRKPKDYYKEVSDLPLQEDKINCYEI